MIETILAGLTLILAFLLSYLFTKIWIPAAKKFGLVGRDLNKYHRPLVAEGGGIAVVFALTSSLYLYIFLKPIFGSLTHTAEIYATISAVVLAGFIGFADDVLGWKKGIRRRYKPFITAVLALPFMTITYIHPEYNYFASWGIPAVVYSFLIVPIGIIGTSNAINMLGGYNGLESGISSIILLAIGIRALMLHEEWIAFMAFVSVATLLGFLYFNWYPAKVFPGDSLTYAIGTYIGALVILGKMVFFGLALFPLFFLDLILAFRAEFIDHAGKILSQGVPHKNGTLELGYRHLYDSCHIAIVLQKKLRGYATERGVVLTLYSIQLIIAFIVIGIAYIWG